MVVVIGRWFVLYVSNVSDFFLTDSFSCALCLKKDFQILFFLYAGANIYGFCNVIYKQGCEYSSL